MNGPNEVQGDVHVPNSDILVSRSKTNKNPSKAVFVFATTEKTYEIGKQIK